MLWIVPVLLGRSPLSVFKKGLKLTMGYSLMLIFISLCGAPEANRLKLFENATTFSWSLSFFIFFRFSKRSQYLLSNWKLCFSYSSTFLFLYYFGCRGSKTVKFILRNFIELHYLGALLVVTTVDSGFQKLQKIRKRGAKLSPKIYLLRIL